MKAQIMDLNASIPIIQLTGRLHNGTAPLITAIGKICPVISPYFGCDGGQSSYHHIASQQFLALQHDPVRKLTWNRAVTAKQTYITKPTGNTKPPNTLTIPGFEAVRPGAPPDMISDNKPPNESKAPATT